MTLLVAPMPGQIGALLQNSPGSQVPGTHDLFLEERRPGGWWKNNLLPRPLGQGASPHWLPQCPTEWSPPWSGGWRVTCLLTHLYGLAPSLPLFPPLLASPGITSQIRHLQALVNAGVHTDTASCAHSQWGHQDTHVKGPSHTKFPFPWVEPVPSLGPEFKSYFCHSGPAVRP